MWKILIRWRVLSSFLFIGQLGPVVVHTDLSRNYGT
jgi:hypothetical protein